MSHWEMHVSLIAPWIYVFLTSYFDNLIHLPNVISYSGPTTVGYIVPLENSNVFSMSYSTSSFPLVNNIKHMDVNEKSKLAQNIVIYTLKEQFNITSNIITDVTKQISGIDLECTNSKNEVSTIQIKCDAKANNNGNLFLEIGEVNKNGDIGL